VARDAKLTPDAVNACFEGVGAFFILLDLRRICIDRSVRGIYWPGRLFFAAWGLWNLMYYPAIGQPLSFIAGSILTTFTFSWIIVVIRFLKD
jgi:hypothetical protein